MQHDYSCLSVPDWQHAGVMQKLVDHAAFSGSGGSIKLEETNAHAPVNSIPAEAYALLAAVEAYALNRDHGTGNTGVGSVDSDHCILMPSEVSFDSWSFLQSPKKFPRTFWKSIARRLVNKVK